MLALEVDIDEMTAMDRVRKIDSRICWALNAQRKPILKKIKVASLLQVRSLMRCSADPSPLLLQIMNLTKVISIRLLPKLCHLTIQLPVKAMTIENSQTCPQVQQIVNFQLSLAEMIRVPTLSQGRDLRRNNCSIDLSKQLSWI